MGRISKWFGSLWSSKSSLDSSPAKGKKKKSKWDPPSTGDDSVKLNNRAEGPWASPYAEGIDANRHAIAVAAATAAVAEAALAAAQAAAEVVRLTSGSQSVREDRRLELAAVRIQSAFRAYLARRALRALKGLVKLQALVRGHIVRKQSADMLRRMQAMARIQARASAHRYFTSESPYAKTGFNDSNYPGFMNPRNYEEWPNSVKNGGSLQKPNHSRSHTGMTSNNESSQIASRWLSHWMEQCAWDQKNTQEASPDDRADKILEIDTWKPRHNSNQNDQNIPTSQYFSAWNTTYKKTNPSPSPEAASSAGGDHHRAVGPACTADDSPRMRSTKHKPAVAANPRGPFTPTRSECSKSLFGEYLGHPSYMANTESSKAKVRSHSVPKQRMMQLEVLGLSSSFGRELWENSDMVSERGSFSVSGPNRGGYLSSGQVRRHGTPAREAGGAGFGSIYGRRF